MKKVFFMLISLMLLLTLTICAQADEPAVPGTSADLGAGAYKAGMDFPEGAYSIRCGNAGDGCCFSFGSNYMKKLASPGSYLGDGSYEICLYSAPVFRLYFDKDDVLNSSYPLLLTAEGSIEIPQDVPAFLDGGIYWVGKDLPAGSYVLQCGPNAVDGCCFAAAADYMDKLSGDNEYLHEGYYETCIYDDESLHLYLDEKDVLKTTDQMKVSLAEPAETAEDSWTLLDRGIYWIGKDIPVGSYVVRCLEGDYGCRFFLASDSLIRLSDPFSEELFQNIDVFVEEGDEYHVFFEEDAVFQTTHPLEISSVGAMIFK